MVILHTTDSATPTATDYVLPAPPRSPGLLLVDPEPVARDAVAEGRVGGEQAVLRSLGERVLLLLDCQQQFLEELRQSVATIGECVAEESRARLWAQVRHLGEVLGWCEEVHSDLRQEGEAAAAGRQPLDPTATCRDVAAAATTARPQQPVTVLGAANRPWWGDAGLLAHALGLALELVAQRTNGQGGRVIEIGDSAGWCSLRVRGTGDGSGRLESGMVQRFRRAVTELEAAVIPDENGSGGCGLVLRLAHRSPNGQPAALAEAAAS